MNILITSPRAPAVLEWIRVALRGGHHVTLCDSLRFPIGRFVRSGKDTDKVYYCHLPAPRKDFYAYQKAIIPLIAQADWVIPTCEDIFYLAQIPLNLHDRAKCFMPERDLLFTLHHKLKVFATLPQSNTVTFSPSRLVTQHRDIIDDNDSGEKTVLKPVFSRFGREVIRGVTMENTQKVSISSKKPWVQQRFIDGKPLCNFALCQHGELVANAVYRPRYLLNDSASTYFESEYDLRIDHFMHDFAEKHRFHGQIAFDFIDDGKMLWVLECNPRVTSGLHLLGKSLNINAMGRLYQQPAEPINAYRVGASLPLLFGIDALKNRRLRQLISDYRRAEDVLSGLPFYASWLSFAEIVGMSLTQRQSLSDISTADIQFDGEIENAR